MRLILTLLVIFASTLYAGAADNFVRVSGTKLLGRDGKSIVLRGTNCGNYMVREPYMMNTSGNLDRQFKFDKMLADVCGEEKVKEFDRLWLDNNFCEEDMRFIAELGLNTLRVPMHYKYFTLPIEKEPVAGEQTWIDEGFERIDSMCVWAERHGILLILDMHACPGGQSPGDICDYDESKPSLWDSEANRTKLVALWRKLAERYKDEKCVAGYDLINEPAWSLPNNNKLLWDTFKAIIKAIREVDTNHIVILEGNWYCNDYTGLPSTKMDAKMMLQFHRYWNYNTAGSIKYMEELGTKYRCPIYLGEFSENSNSWVADCVRLCEVKSTFAAWTSWPMKKSGLNTFLQVKRVSSYDNVISQWQNGTRPSATTLWNACKAWAEAQHISRCTVCTDYIDALLRRPYTDECQPYTGKKAGDYVYAAHYDMGACGRAYWDTDDADYHSTEGSYTSWQHGGALRNDGVDVYSGVSDTWNCGYYVGETKDGEWLQYTIDNPEEAASWQMQLRYAVNSGTAKIRVTVNDRTVVPTTSLTSTGGYTSWSTRSFRNIILPSGSLRIRIYIEKGGVNLNWFRFLGKKAATEEELSVLKPDTDCERNHLVNGECEFQGAWRTAALAEINTAKYEWNVTSGTPSKGQGGALRISAMREHSLNTMVYQPVDVEAGHTYSVDVAVKGASGNGDFWIQAYMLKDEPSDREDIGAQANCIGELNSWNDASLAAYDGMMSARAKAGSSHTTGVMKWRATTTGTVYFALKVGTQKTSFSYTFDNFTLTDLTDIQETAVDMVEADDSQLIPGSESRTYNLSGQPVTAGAKLAGVYIVSNGRRTKKVMMK